MAKSNITTQPDRLDTSRPEVRFDNPAEVLDAMQELEDALASVAKESKEIRKDFITIFGLFASLVTFLSVEVQIFKNVTNFWNVIGISSFFVAALLGFAVVLREIASEPEAKSKLTRTVIGTIVIFLIMAIFSLLIGGKIIK